MLKSGVKALFANRSVAFAVLSFAFAYGAGWSGTPDVTVLQSETAAYAEDVYSPVDAASPTDWLDPYPEKIWVNEEQPSPECDPGGDGSSVEL